MDNRSKNSIEVTSIKGTLRLITTLRCKKLRIHPNMNTAGQPHSKRPATSPASTKQWAVQNMDKPQASREAIECMLTKKRSMSHT